MKTFNLDQYNPCQEGLEFFKACNEDPSQAWETCHRGDWMLWIAAKIRVSKRTLVLAKAYCARTVYHLMNKHESREAIVVAINYGRGLATEEELKKATTAAYAAADADAYAAAYAATIAAYAAAYAATTATTATIATIAAAYAATTATTAAAAAAAAYAATAAYDEALIKNRRKTADICRKYLTKEVFEILKQY